MSRPRVLLTRRWPDSVEARLCELFDTTLSANDLPMSVESLQKAMQSYDAVCPSVCDNIGVEVLSVPNRRCRILGNFGVGFNHIDIEFARRVGLIVTNTPGVLTEATADLAMTLLLMSARRAGEGERLVRGGQWRGWAPTQMMGSDVTGATLGLIGFGRIGRAMARKAHFGFGMDVLYYKPASLGQADDDAPWLGRCDTIEALLSRSDYVSLHCPGGVGTRHLINAAALDWMKPTAHLINTARGDVVDSRALIDALRTKRIAGAGLDVYEGEPNIDPDLLALDNVVLLPHLGSATLATRTAMGDKVVENLRAFFAGRDGLDRVA